MTYSFQRKTLEIYLFQIFSSDLNVNVILAVECTDCKSLLLKHEYELIDGQFARGKSLYCKCCEFSVETKNPIITLEDLADRAIDMGCRHRVVGVQ